MNTLQELNDYGDEVIQAADQRAPNIIINPAVAPHQYVNISQGQSYSSPVGIKVEEIIQYEISDVYYQIDVGAVANATVSWTTIPTGMTVTNPSTGIFKIGPLILVDQWDTIKSPTISIPDVYYGFFTYSSGLIYSDGDKSWVTSVNVSQGTDLSYTSPFYYTENVTNYIAGNPTIISNNTASSFTLTITPTDLTIINTISSSGSGGTVSFNNTSKVYTISGTKTQINSHLASLQFLSFNLLVDSVWTYKLRDNTNNIISIKTQSILNASILIISAVRSDYYYNEGQSINIVGSPLITNINQDDGSSAYTLEIKPSDISSVNTLGLSGSVSGLSVSFNNSTKILTIIGTKAIINNKLDNIVLTAQGDYDTTIYLIYKLTTPTGNIASRTQYIYPYIVDQEIININYPRSYDANTGSFLFIDNMPQIDDFSSDSQLYTITLSSSNGEFGHITTGQSAYITNNWVYTGTKSQINSLFSQIKFFPTKDFKGSDNPIYTQTKDGTLQISQQIALTYSGITVSILGRGEIALSNSAWIPPVEVKKYGRLSATLIGGGGGSPAGYQSGGGGGGGVALANNITLSSNTYSIQIGGGGSSSGTGGNTTAFGVTAYGGLSGYKSSAASPNQGKGGSSGAPTTHITTSTYGGGGGGAATDSGQDYTNPYTNIYRPAYYWSGGRGLYDERSIILNCTKTSQQENINSGSSLVRDRFLITSSNSYVGSWWKINTIPSSGLVYKLINTDSPTLYVTDSSYNQGRVLANYCIVENNIPTSYILIWDYGFGHAVNETINLDLRQNRKSPILGTGGNGWITTTTNTFNAAYTLNGIYGDGGGKTDPSQGNSSPGVGGNAGGILISYFK